METYNIQSRIPGFWLDTLTEEVEPLLEGITFSTYYEKRFANSDEMVPYVLICLDGAGMGPRKEFLAHLQGIDILERGVIENALKNFVRERIGHKI
jgi:hypothetical protein